MKYYTTSGYRGNKNMALRRFLIVLIFVFSTIIVTIIYGNHLKSKLDESGIETEPVVVAETNDTESIKIPEASTKVETITVNGAYLSATDAVLYKDVLKTFSSEGYNAFAFKLIENGTYTCTLPTLSELTKSAGGSIPYSLLTEMTSDAKKLSLYTSAILPASDIFKGDAVSGAGIYLDAVIAGDISKAGFNEILITNLFKSDTLPGSDETFTIVSYISELRKAAPDINICIALPYQMFSDKDAKAELDLISEYADFLSLDMTSYGIDVSELDSAISSISLSISMYNLRVLIIDTDDAIKTALAENNIKNILQLK